MVPGEDVYACRSRLFDRQGIWTSLGTGAEHSAPCCRWLHTAQISGVFNSLGKCKLDMEKQDKHIYLEVRCVTFVLQRFYLRWLLVLHGHSSSMFCFSADIPSL